MSLDFVVQKSADEAYGKRPGRELRLKSRSLLSRLAFFMDGARSIHDISMWISGQESAANGDEIRKL